MKKSSRIKPKQPNLLISQKLNIKFECKVNKLAYKSISIQEINRLTAYQILDI